MGITIIATPGSETANSYLTLADAETYFESRIGSTDWDSATDAVKNALLVNGTRLLDQSFNWSGDKADDDQALRFPRDYCYNCDGVLLSSLTIPTEIENATCEMALFVVGNTGQSTSNEYKRAEVGSLKVEYRDNISPEELVNSSVVRAVGCVGTLSIGGGSIRMERY